VAAKDHSTVSFLSPLDIKEKTAMNASPELKDLMVDWYRAVSVGDTSGAVEGLFSRQEGFLAVGTDPTEWIKGSEEVIQSYQMMVRAGTLIKVKVIEQEAYSEGTVGWVVDRVIYLLPNGREVPVRHTIALHKEDNGWRIVHKHDSIGVLNQDIGWEAA
jgi:ketosteroid isomerase-like protein